jgi:hypothetical protein
MPEENKQTNNSYYTCSARVCSGSNLQSAMLVSATCTAALLTTGSGTVLGRYTLARRAATKGEHCCAGLLRAKTQMTAEQTERRAAHCARMIERLGRRCCTPPSRAHGHGRREAHRICTAVSPAPVKTEPEHPNARTGTSERRTGRKGATPKIAEN